ncbi:hypothetical protein LJC36_05195 [Desulfovibrio sp. OttesenSCG-928-C14]|nr:hypothetical protein [Desulfovibrio sp. OttesenSCG-928-C14]
MSGKFRLNTNELQSAGFWISQLFIILATALGVFLAANQGFKLAIEFDNIKSVENNYYLRKSLQSELASNVEYIREYISKVERRIDKPELVLETFVWDSMTYSSSALETPPALLKEAQMFYRRAREIMATPYYNNINKANFLRELAEHVEKNVLPQFEKNTRELKDWLKDKDKNV